MIKRFRSNKYNTDFNVTTGYMKRWGSTLNENPVMCKFGPEIVDIEVSTICSKGCKTCYKSNTKNGKNMNFETFKIIFDKIPKEIFQQIAFGVGDIDSNKDLFAMMSYCRENNIVPNITINGEKLTENIISNLHRYCGAIAVSNYNEDTCFDSVKIFTDLGMDQINIHQLVSKETLSDCYSVIDKFQIDPRLSKLNAIVFLHLKEKGNRNTYNMVSDKEYKNLVEYCISKKIKFGFDSCSAHKFSESLSPENKLKYEEFIEPCESGLFSAYINTDGRYFHCSFTENETGWDGIDVINNDFIKDVWFGKETEKFRTGLLCNNRKCPIFPLDN